MHLPCCILSGSQRHAEICKAGSCIPFLLSPSSLRSAFFRKVLFVHLLLVCNPTFPCVHGRKHGNPHAVHLTLLPYVKSSLALQLAQQFHWIWLHDLGMGDHSGLRGRPKQINILETAANFIDRTFCSAAHPSWVPAGPLGHIVCHLAWPTFLPNLVLSALP